MKPAARAIDVDLADYLHVVRKRWTWIVASIVVIAALAAVWTATRPDIYRAEARVLLADSAAQDAIDRTANIVTIRNRDLANEINIAESDDVVAIVRDRLGLGTDDRLPSGTIAAASNSDVIEFTFTAGTGDDAARFANEWARAYVEVKQAKAQASIEQAVGQLEATLIDLRVEREAIRADLDALEDRLARSAEAEREGLQLQVDREAGAISGELSLVDARIEANIESITTLQLSGELAAVGEAEISREATASTLPTNAPLSRVVPVAVLLGTFVGIGLALLAQSLDQSVTSPEDLAALGLTTLASVPQASKELRRGELALVGLEHPGSPVADGYQKARTALQFAAIDRDLRSILVTSANQGEGKTTTSVNLACAFAAVGKRVVLADVDLRRPRLHEVFSTEPTPGVTDVVLGDANIEAIAVRTVHSPETLAVLPAGTLPPNPSSLLASDQFAATAESLEQASDLLVLDAAPVLAVADTLTIVHQVDGVIIVVSAGSTGRNELQRTLETVRQSGGEILGAILIGGDDAGRYGTYYGEAKSEPRTRNEGLFGPAESTNTDVDEAVDLRQIKDEPAGEQPTFFVPRSRLLGP